MNARKAVAILTAGIIVLVGLTILGGSWYTIDQGERGVVLRNGAVIGTAEPGLGFKIPLMESVKRISTQSNSRQYPEVASYSRDQQSATIKLSVNYRIPADQVIDVYSNYGGEEALVTRLLDRRVFEDVKTVFGRFNAVTSIQERARLNQEVSEAIRLSVKGPLLIEGIQIENIDFSDAYEKSIENRMLAEVEVQKLEQNAKREKVQAEITVTQAKAAGDAERQKAQASADATRLQAAAEAEQIQLKGEAEASAIRAKGDALRDNPGLVSLIQAERWTGVLPTTMLPGSSVPMLTLK